DGHEIARTAAGGIVFPQIATDGTRVFFARTDNNICRIDACRGPYSTIASGPVLSGTIAIFATTGSSLNSSRFFAWLDDGSIQPSVVLADFAGNTPGIAPDGTVYSGAIQNIVADTFDGVAWTAPQVTSETPHYTGFPAFRGNQLLLSTVAAGTIDVFT